MNNNSFITIYDGKLSKIEYDFDFLREQISTFFDIGDFRGKSRIQIMVYARAIFFLFATKKYPQRIIAEYLNLNRSTFASIPKRYEKNFDFITKYNTFLDYYFLHFELNIYIYLKVILPRNKINKLHISMLKKSEELKIYKNREKDIKRLLGGYLYKNGIYDDAEEAISIIRKLIEIYKLNNLSLKNLYTLTI